MALGYIAKPDENSEKAVADTVAELRYNLSEAYQDADRHAEALEILRELHKGDPDEQRYAVHRFISCQALGRIDEMREIVEDLDGRRREDYTDALTHLKEMSEVVRKRLEERKALEAVKQAKKAADDATKLEEEPRQSPVGPASPISPIPEAEEAAEELEKTEARILSLEERKELAKWRNLARFDPPVVDFLKAQVRAMENQPAEALELLQRVQEAHLARPGLFLQTADLFMKLGRWQEAEQTFAKALAVDPDNPHAHVGLSRMALRSARFYRSGAIGPGCSAAALSLSDGAFSSWGGHGAAQTVAPRCRGAACRPVTQSQLPPAHLRLAWILRRLGDATAAAEHLRLFHELKADKTHGKSRPELAQPEAKPAERSAADAPSADLPATTCAVQMHEELVPDWHEAVVVVSGLPRSGTSMVMQMLAAGGLPVMSDGHRAADEDNPLGYLEYEPVKHLSENADWLKDAKGHAIKIVAPLLHYLPRDQDYCIVFIERDVDEVLASQSQMVQRRGAKIDDTPKRRARLKEAYSRQLANLRTTLQQRPRTRTLFLKHAEVMRQPQGAAEMLGSFLGGGLNPAAMAVEVKPGLHRHRKA